MKNLFFALLVTVLSLGWCDSEIQSPVSMTSSKILNNDDRAAFSDHLGDVIFVELFATT